MGDPREIVNALRRGVPPEYDLGEFSVGRAGTTQRFLADLEEVRRGKSIVRYLDADFGQGKSHFLKSLREQAFGEAFVVSIVELSSRACPLFGLVEVYRQVIDGMRTAASPRLPALETVLDRWLEMQRVAPESKRIATLERLPALLQAALFAFLQASSGRPSLQRREAVVRYLTGEKFGRAERDRLELFENVTDATALTVLGSIASFVRDLGYGGLCVLLDEAEGIVSFARSSQREEAVGNLVRLIRMTSTARGCYFVYAATPSFFDAYGGRPDLGLRSDSGVLRLEPLSRGDIDELVERVVGIYDAAYSVTTPRTIVTGIKEALPVDYGRVSDLTRGIVAVLDERRAADG